MSKSAKATIICLGNGGHARVVHELVDQSDVGMLAGYVAPEDGGATTGIPYLGKDSELEDLRAAGKTHFVNGIGGITNLAVRAAAFDAAIAAGLTPVTVQHPTSIVSPGAHVGEGTTIMAGAIIQTGARIGKNVILNTGCIVEHDCQIGDHCHLAPGTVLAGDVSIGSMTFVGLGARVLQGRRIGSRCLIGAASLVHRDIPDGKTALGLPARIIKTDPPTT